MSPLAGAADSAGANGASEHAHSSWRLGDIQDEQVGSIQPASRLAFLFEPNGSGADRFRFLRMRLREFSALTRLRTIVITSPLPEDGKSTMVLNLATVLAEGGRKSVLVVEADLRHPSLAERIGLPAGPGLAECLESGVNVAPMIRRLRQLEWFLLRAGKPSGNPTELLQSPFLSGMLKELSERFDWVLIDTPPVAPLTDAVSLSRLTDASLLVVRAGRTPQKQTELAIKLLGQEKLLGILFNGAAGLNRLYSKYYRHYGQTNFAK